jgi:hypothetical protein
MCEESTTGPDGSTEGEREEAIPNSTESEETEEEELLKAASARKEEADELPRLEEHSQAQRLQSEEAGSSEDPLEASAPPEAEPRGAAEEMPCPSRPSPADRERMKLEKKLREVGRLQARAAAGEALEPLQLEKIARAGQIRAAVANLCSPSQVAEKGNCDVLVTGTEPPYQAEPAVRAGSSQDNTVSTLPVEQSPNSDALTEAPEEPNEKEEDQAGDEEVPEQYTFSTWADPPDVKSWGHDTQWARPRGKSSTGKWKKSPKGETRPWKENWSSSSKWDSWMAPLDDGFAPSAKRPSSDNVCWNWQKWGSCPRMGKCTWEHPGAVTEAQPLAQEPQTEIQYWQVVGADSDGNLMLGELVGVQPGPKMAGTELMAGVEMPLQEMYPVQSRDQGEAAYWKNWEEER